jgi:class 3 adenylate cyclase
MAESRTRFPLWLKLLIGALLLAALPAVAIGTMSYLRSTGVLEQQARSTQAVLSNSLNDAVQHTLGGAKNDMYTVARLLQTADLPDAQKEVLVNTAISASEALDHVVAYDAQGMYIDRFIEKKDLQVPTAPQHFTVADLEHLFVGDAVQLPSEIRVPLAMALVGTDGTLNGYLLTYVSLEPVQVVLQRLSDDFLESNPRNMLLVDRQLRVIAATSAAETASMAPQTSLEILHNARAQLLNGSKEYGPEYSDGAATMVGTSSPVLGWPFLLVVQQPRDVVYVELLRLRNRVIVVVVVALAVAALLAFGFARMVTAPIRKLVAFTRTLAARKFGERVAIETRDELSTLGQALNQSAQDLGDSEQQIRHEHEIRNDLSRYLPAPIVEKVVAREQDMGLGGKRREISVVFADVVGFTPLTGKLEPEVVVSILNELFTIMSEIVFRHGGMIDKFIGDSMMALWGAPEATEDHAERAVAAALDMQKWLEFGRKRWKDRYDISIDVAIGINTGTAVVGNIGSQTRMEYTAIGESVNIAARVESVARPRQVLITAATKAALPDVYDVVEIGEKQLPGREKPTMLYEVNA